MPLSEPAAGGPGPVLKRCTWGCSEGLARPAVGVILKLEWPKLGNGATSGATSLACGAVAITVGGRGITRPLASPVRPGMAAEAVGAAAKSAPF